MISSRLKHFFKNAQFVDVATCDKQCRPNAAPKFLLKVENDKIYLADYVFGKTWHNLQENPLVSLTILDYDSLVGYQFNGEACLLSEGEDYGTLKKYFQVKQVKSSVERVIKSVREEKLRRNFELTFPDKTGIIIVTVKEIVDIDPTGQLTREK
jgi:predicted pyridoxine 5'-phosphate oxidase superfamily flavin-nucleotide-binding protein